MIDRIQYKYVYEYIYTHKYIIKFGNTIYLNVF
jgi:hypothetical protein